MALLAATLYDPAANATKATSALLAMTALDTTNLRLTFTVPANGTVLVRLRGVTKGASTSAQLLYGVLEGSTVRGRQIPITGKWSASANALLSGESCFLVTGLTPGASLTWDAAYGVEFAVASTVISIGGPNNATGNDNAGGFVFEIWEATNLLAGKLYDPATLQTKAATTALAMTALDTTNLRLSFTVPASGRVLVKIRVAFTGGSAATALMLGVLEGATVRGRAAPVGGIADVGALVATDYCVQESVVPVTGLTPGASLTWDAAYGVELGSASTNIVYGGPDNATANDAGGGAAFEVWAA